MDLSRLSSDSLEPRADREGPQWLCRGLSQSSREYRRKVFLALPHRSQAPINRFSRSPIRQQAAQASCLQLCAQREDFLPNSRWVIQLLSLLVSVSPCLDHTNRYSLGQETYSPMVEFILATCYIRYRRTQIRQKTTFSRGNYETNAEEISDSVTRRRGH